jgi:DNA-binding transcriptional LysR family regulator
MIPERGPLSKLSGTKLAGEWSAGLETKAPGKRTDMFHGTPTGETGKTEVTVDFMQLEMFVATVEEGSVHKTARRVYRTQPAVSIALRKLEQQVGAPLFDRTNRNGYLLTDTGEILFGYARRLLNLRDESLLAIQDLHNIQSGRLRIGANESASLHLLPGLVRDFRDKYPKVKIEIIRNVSRLLLRELSDKNLDFAVLSFLPEGDDIEGTPIAKDELVLVVSPRHRLGGSKTVHIRDLGGERFIAHNVRSVSREKVIDAFRRHKTPLNITIEIATIEAIKKFVARDLGISFVPLMCIKEELASGELCRVEVEGIRYERTLWLVRRATDTQHHAARAFLELIRRMGPLCDEGPVSGPDFIPNSGEEVRV